MNKNEMAEYAAGIISSLAMKCFDDPQGIESMRFARELVSIYTRRIESSGEPLELFKLIGNCASAMNTLLDRDECLDAVKMAHKAAEFSIY